ncbi:MAG TPA: hypothetical protein VFB45_26730 [Pseudolabrys sp.]|nr:hypothetical protein [Pseudolabrys sp.]
MVRSHCAAAALFALLIGTAHAADDVRACKFAVKARCASGEATVTLVDGAVKRLEVDVEWCSGQRGQPGYECSIDSSRGDADSTWSEEGGATIIANKAPFNPSAPDSVKVTVGRNVSIDFAKAQSLGRCGAGAELPKAIVIPAGKKACGVFLATP